MSPIWVDGLTALHRGSAAGHQARTWPTQSSYFDAH